MESCVALAPCHCRHDSNNDDCHYGANTHLEQEEELGAAVVGFELATRHCQRAVCIERQHRLLIESTIVLEVLLVHWHL